MKTYIKLFALVCVVAFSASLLTACADKPATPPPPAPEPVKPNS